MKKLRIGVIGTGRIGRLHANNLVSSVKDADVVAVSDMNLPAAREVAQALHLLIHRYPFRHFDGGCTGRKAYFL